MCATLSTVLFLCFTSVDARRFVAHPSSKVQDNNVEHEQEELVANDKEELDAKKGLTATRTYSDTVKYHHILNSVACIQLEVSGVGGTPHDVLQMGPCPDPPWSTTPLARPCSAGETEGEYSCQQLFPEADVPKQVQRQVFFKDILTNSQPVWVGSSVHSA